MLTDFMLRRLQYTGVFWVCTVKSGRWTANVYQITRCHIQQNYNMNVHREQNLKSDYSILLQNRVDITERIIFNTRLCLQRTTHFIRGCKQITQ
jgi:hypothetical protein